MFTATALPDPDRHAAFYSGVPLKRAGAWVFDTILVAAICAFVVVMTLGLALLILAIVFPVVSFVYRWVGIANWGGTPGMLLVGLRVLDRQGGRPSQGTAFLHTFLYSVAILTLLPQIASIGLMLTGPRAQGLHDLALGTAVINRPG